MTIFNFLLSFTRGVGFFNLKLLFLPILNTILMCGLSARQYVLKYAMACLDLNSDRRFIFSLLAEGFSVSPFSGQIALCATHRKENKSIQNGEGRWDFT